MKMLPLLLLALLAGSAAAAPAPALPSDSVYQLQASMADQSGRSLQWSQQRGKPRVVSMFYTSCPYICPLIVDSGKAIEKSLSAQERERLGITLVSMDPKRDTPKALAELAERRSLPAAGWTLLQPAPADVRRIAGVLGIRYRALPDGEFNHTSVLILLDEQGRVVARTEQLGTRLEPEFVAAVHKALAAPGKTSPANVNPTKAGPSKG